MGQNLNTDNGVPDPFPEMKAVQYWKVKGGLVALIVVVNMFVRNVLFYCIQIKGI
jgi:hypothetical protein